MRAPHKVKLLSILSCAIIAFALEPSAALADETMQADVSIERAARASLANQARDAGLKDPSIQITVLHGNPPGEPQRCVGKIQVEALDTRSTRRMRFAAECTQPAWRTERIVRGSIAADVVVAVDAITANRPIARGELAVEKHDLSVTPDALSDPDEVVGKAAKRPFRKGEIIGRRWLAEAILVQRGSIVSITVRQSGVDAQVAGEVMEPGRRNDVVHVRNTASGKVILARVLTRDTVEPASLPGQ